MDIEASLRIVHLSTIVASVVLLNVIFIVGFEVALKTIVVQEGLAAMVANVAETVMASFEVSVEICGSVETFVAFRTYCFVILSVSGLVVFEELLFAEVLVAE